MIFTDCNTIGACLIRYREAKNLTQRELSKQVNITLIFLIAIEKEVIELTPPMRQKVITMLDLPLDAFDHIK